MRLGSGADTEQALNTRCVTASATLKTSCHGRKLDSISNVKRWCLRGDKAPDEAGHSCRCRLRDGNQLGLVMFGTKSGRCQEHHLLTMLLRAGMCCLKAPRQRRQLGVRTKRRQRLIFKCHRKLIIHRVHASCKYLLVLVEISSSTNATLRHML